MAGSYELHGPLLAGDPKGIVFKYVERMKDDVAIKGLDRVQARLHVVLKHPSGRYQRTVRVQHRSDPRIYGSGTVYGRWLEGTSSRNRTTRFKGYKTFRIVRDQLKADVPDLVRPMLMQLIRELNG